MGVIDSQQEGASVDQWPALLVLSIEGPNLRHAGGILLYRLLHDYPTDRLYVIERDADPTRGHLDCTYKSLTTPWRRFEHSRFHRIKRSLRAFGLVPKVSLRTIDKLLGDFRPDVILCVMQHAAYYDTAYHFARSRGLPLLLIVHDVNEQFEPVFSSVLAAARRRDAEIYRYARARLCVSPEMEELNERLYGIRGEVMYPNRSDDLSARPVEESATLKSSRGLSVGFVGNLNYGYGEELLRLVPAFREAGARIVIFSHPPGQSCMALLDATDVCDFRGFVPSEVAWQRIKCDCDAVILPYLNPADYMERLYSHHFPSKLPEYLALGMPVIVTGPPEATGVKWALRHPKAIACHTGTDLQGVASMLRSLTDSAEWRLALAQAALAAGIAEFDPIAIKRHFIGLVRAAAVQSAPRTVF